MPIPARDVQQRLLDGIVGLQLAPETARETEEQISQRTEQALQRLRVPRLRGPHDPVQLAAVMAQCTTSPRSWRAGMPTS